MRKNIMFFTLGLFVALILILLICNVKNKEKNISLHAITTEITVEVGSIDEPIFNNTLDDLEYFMKISGMSIQEAIDVRDNPENYLFLTYTIELENSGDIELYFKDIGNIDDDGVWLLKQIDGYMSISPSTTDRIHIFFVTKNLQENRNKIISVPLIFESKQSFIGHCNSVTVWTTNR